MSRNSRLLSWVYAALLNLFPKEYRHKFGDEPQEVFKLLMEDAHHQGSFAVLSLGMREIIAVLRSLLEEYWRVFEQREGNMGLDNLLDWQFSAAERASPQPTRREIILVMAPFLILLFILSIPQLLLLSGAATRDAYTISIVQAIVGGSMPLLLLGSLIYAWRTKWPRWSATWYLPFCLLLMFPIVYLSTLFEDVSMLADIFSEFAAYFLLPMIIALLLYWVTRLDPIKGLLAVLPIVTFIWTPNMEFVPDQVEIPISILSMVFAAAGAVAILKLGDWRSGLRLTILVAALIGLPHSYAGIYLGGSLPSSAADPSILEVMKNFIPQFLAVSTIILGPFLAVSFRSIGRFSGLTGRISYHLILFGMFLMLVSVLANFFQMADSRVQSLRVSANLMLSELFLFGLAFYLIAVVLLGGAYLRRGPMRGWLEYTLLSLLTLLLPAVLMMPVMQPFSTYLLALNTFAWIYSLPLTVITSLGFTWLILAGWLVTHHNQQNNTPRKLQIV